MLQRTFDREEESASFFPSREKSSRITDTRTQLLVVEQETVSASKGEDDLIFGHSLH